MKLFGLIGYPLMHSFSRAFFSKKFLDEGIDAEYQNFEIPSIEEFPKIISRHADLYGLNVTLPYKQAVIPYLDELSNEAREIGAVNVVRVAHAGTSVRLKGFNADVIGFVRSLQPLLKPSHRKALVLGTGGASKAIVYGLHSLSIDTLQVSRHPEAGMIGYDGITAAVLDEYTVIVNCTPCGMYPHVAECPDIPYHRLDSRHLLYDLVYNPEETLFLRQGRRQGCIVKNGLEMLHLQALASWDYWNGKE